MWVWEVFSSQRVDENELRMQETNFITVDVRFSWAFVFKGCWLGKCWRLISNFFQSVLSIWVQRNVLTQILRCQVKLSSFLYTVYSFSKEQYLWQKCKVKVGKMFFIYAIEMKRKLVSRNLRGLQFRNAALDFMDYYAFRSVAF